MTNSNSIVYNFLEILKIWKYIYLCVHNERTTSCCRRNDILCVCVQCKLISGKDKLEVFETIETLQNVLYRGLKTKTDNSYFSHFDKF